MLAIALEAEINAYISKYADIQTSFGPISAKVPRAKNRTEKEIESFESALRKGSAGYSSASISRLKKQWIVENDKWKSSNLSNKKYCYISVNGKYYCSHLNIFLPWQKAKDHTNALLSQKKGI